MQGQQNMKYSLNVTLEVGNSDQNVRRVPLYLQGPSEASEALWKMKYFLYVHLLHTNECTVIL